MITLYGLNDSIEILWSLVVENEIEALSSAHDIMTRLDTDYAHPDVLVMDNNGKAFSWMDLDFAPMKFKHDFNKLEWAKE